MQVLAEMKKAVADVDSRPDIHFCQQILIAGLLTGSGSTMDQRKTMDVLDVLAIEGGYSYGFAENDGRWESDEMEAVLTRGVHFFSLVADYAAAVVRGKPGKTVADQEHYCMRYDGKDRIPSLPADFPTSLWASVFHGVSASSIFNWSGGKWQWSDMEGARKFARSMKYRGAALLNPYCYPEKTLSGLRGFMEELEPLRNVVLPMPRLKRPEAAILFSITSQRMLGDRQSLPNMENWYNALLREQLPAEFVFEEELSAENLKPYKILFIPDLKHSLPVRSMCWRSLFNGADQSCAPRMPSRWIRMDCRWKTDHFFNRKMCGVVPKGWSAPGCETSLPRRFPVPEPRFIWNCERRRERSFARRRRS